MLKAAAASAGAASAAAPPPPPFFASAEQQQGRHRADERNIWHSLQQVATVGVSCGAHPTQLTFGVGRKLLPDCRRRRSRRRLGSCHSSGAAAGALASCYSLGSTSSPAKRGRAGGSSARTLSAAPQCVPTAPTLCLQHRTGPGCRSAAGAPCVAAATCCRKLGQETVAGAAQRRQLVKLSQNAGSKRQIGKEHAAVCAAAASGRCRRQLAAARPAREARCAAEATCDAAQSSRRIQ